jgi:hypothetical protein
MNQKLVIYIIVGAAATGIAYYLWKQEQATAAPAASSGLGTAGNTALGYVLGGAVGAAAGYFESN